MQTKSQSLVEALTNVVVGYITNFTANFIIFPLFGWDLTLEQNLLFGLIFTIISILRSYGLRRYYNWKHRGTHI